MPEGGLKPALPGRLAWRSERRVGFGPPSVSPLASGPLSPLVTPMFAPKPNTVVSGAVTTRQTPPTGETGVKTRPDEMPIIRTKLHRPPVTDKLVFRKRLHERMDLGLQMPLTVVSAPAGYGKSMLVSHWVEIAGPALRVAVTGHHRKRRSCLSGICPGRGADVLSRRLRANRGDGTVTHLRNGFDARRLPPQRP